MSTSPSLNRDILDRLFASIPDSYAVVSLPDFTLVAITDELLASTMSERHTVLGMSVFDAFPADPQDAEANALDHLRDSFQRVIDNQQADVMQLERHPIRNSYSGVMETRYWHVVNVPVFVPEGELSHILMKVEDVTGLVREHTVLENGLDLTTLRQLQISEAQLADRRDAVQLLLKRLTTTLESMTDAFFLLDRDWRFSYLNGMAGAVLHRAPEDLLGKNVWDEFPEAVGTQFYSRYHEAVRSGKPQHFEDFYPPLNEWFEVNAYPSAEGIAVYFRPVTRRKQLEQEVREAEQRFRYAVQVTLDVIWDWNLKTDHIWWSQGICTNFGYRPEDIEPDSSGWSRRIHPQDHDAVLASVHAVLDDPGQNEWTMEYRFQRSNGDWALVEDHGFVIRDDDGEAVRMVGGLRDITEDRAIQQQLRESQRMEAVGQLTGGLAHDFNNLLTVMLGNADLVAEQLDDDHPLLPLIRTIQSAAQKGADLTQRLLAFSRRQALEPRATDINQLVQGLTAMLGRTLGEHISIGWLPDPALWLASIDPTQLESALLNICINARDAMPEGGSLTIETANRIIDEKYSARFDELLPGEYVEISITDTGSGIPEDVQKRIFEPFFTTKPRGKGTGLGLSMVFGFLKQSGGHINVYSEPGFGTTMRLYLPRDRSQEPVSVVTEAPVRNLSGNETIVVVEDEAMVRQFVEEQLRQAGYQVHSASNGPEALLLLGALGQVDLLFTDVMMPGGMTGRDLADRVRVTRPEIRVLYMSGYTENAIVHHGRLDPGVALLSKPFRKNDLLARIRSMLDDRQ